MDGETIKTGFIILTILTILRIL